MIEEILFILNKTSGHINNMIAVAESVPKCYKKIFLIGNNEHEIKIMEKLNYNKIIYKSWRQLYYFFKKRNIIYVLSSGGKFSAPAIILAKAFDIQTGFIEPNYFPGQASILLSYKSDTFCDNQEYKKYFYNFIKAENPIRKQIKDIKPFIGKNCNYQKVVLIMGGSNGIKSLNDAVFNNLHYFKDIHIILILGRLFQIPDCIYPNLTIYQYTDDIQELYKRVDFVVTAAGANSIQELLYLQIPFLLYPLPNSKHDHQLQNAIYINHMLPNSYYLDPEEILCKTAGIVNTPKLLEAMKTNLKKINYKGNPKIICNNIIFNKKKRFSIIKFVIAIYSILINYFNFKFLLFFNKEVTKFKKELKYDYVKYEEIPKDLIKCVLIREDGNFFNHNGYPYGNRTIFYLIKGIFLGYGCSGIVQQSIRNIFYELRKEDKFYNFKRKIMEILLTYYVNKFYSKQQILEYYFNVICYLDFKAKRIDKFGIKYLSYILFEKEIKELSLAESMIISRILVNPIYYIKKKNELPKNLMPSLIKLLDDLKKLKYINQNEYEITELELKQLILQDN
ncbi:Transglycosylase [seawater metagenome]|uniref:Transglycosylase n=1 Tax=seawater metagenome TaxID=1561972 RepID=A0A5E8CME7_9ZZZZ